MAKAKIKPNATTKLEDQPQTETIAPAKELTFVCKVCGQSRPLEDMRVASMFFPPLIICPKCETNIR